jgi:hypothetical protein
MIDIRRLPPKNLKIEHKKYFDSVSFIELPDPSINICKNSILFDNGVVFNFHGVNTQSLLYDTRINEDGFRLRLFKFFVKTFFSLNVSFVFSRKINTTVINEWSNNYFHWITEVLPKIIYLKENFSEIDILLPRQYVSEYQISSLKLLGVSIRKIKKLAFVNNLILPSRQAPYPAHYNPKYLSMLTNTILCNTTLNISLGRRLFVTRKTASCRKIQNEEEVKIVVGKYGFAIVDFAEYQFEQQVSISRSADIIMGIHGAGLTNILFCKEGATVFEFSIENQSLDKCYYALSDACGLNYYYQFCKSVQHNQNYLTNDIIVDITLLQINLSKLNLS